MYGAGVRVCVRSDWLDLNDLCQRTGLHLSWQGPHGARLLSENGN